MKFLRDLVSTTREKVSIKEDTCESIDLPNIDSSRYYDKGKYYEQKFRASIADRIDDGIGLSTDELERMQTFSIKDIVRGEDEQFEFIDSIIELYGKTFALSWKKTKTRNCHDVFNKQPFEIKI